ncbi:MAG: potassium channel family protein [Ilumatobacteraceae bacterium]
MEPTPRRRRRVISAEALRSEHDVRSPADLQRLSDFDQRIYLPLVLSALLPIVLAAGNAADDSGVSIAVNVASWLVFVIDLVVHVRLIRHYLRSPVGIFDLVVVVITAPWFLIPGLGGSQVLVLARLARLLRLLFVSKAARRAGRRLGKVGIFALGMLVFSAWMAYVAEEPTNPDFATYGDALWWGIVTLTTVGYGDIVPITEKGRIAGTALMLTGIGTLGLISGTLASAFGGHHDENDTPDPSPPGEATSPAAGADLAAAVVSVREVLATVQERLDAVAATAGLTPRPDDLEGSEKV